MHVRFSDDDASQEGEARWHAEFKRRTGYDHPDTPAEWRRLMIIAGFTPQQIRAVQEGNWEGYQTPECRAGEVPVDLSFTEYLTTRLEALRPAQPADSDTEPAQQPAGYFSAKQLAARHGLDPEKLRRRLDRWRANHKSDDGWTEHEDMIKNQPRYKNGRETGA